MHIRWRRRPLHAAPCALTIGSFDGVHLGHQALIAQLREQAAQRRLPTCVLTFEPQPREWFARQQGQTPPGRISTLRDKLQALAAAGVEEVVVRRFDAALAALTPEAFIERVLMADLHCRHLLIGDDFRFGARRAGSLATLQSAAAVHGYSVGALQTVALAGERVSSSGIRSELAAGDLAHAARLLGKPWAVSGHVVAGKRLGRSLGFRTLNQRVVAAPPTLGIFVSAVHGLAEHALPAVSSLGVRPTIEQAGRVLLETHVLDWPAALGSEAGYGRCIRTELLHKLHDERHYASLEALTDGIAQDVVDARAWWEGVRCWSIHTR